FHLNLTAFGLLSFFVGLFIVNSAIGLAFEQRLPMLRTLRACGVSARMLNSVLVTELVSLALVAGLAGLVCGYFIAAALLPVVSGFAVLAALLLGAALLLPGILERVLTLGERHTTQPLPKWFFADSRQQLSGLSLALMALLLALAVNVGVGTMVESFSRTFVTWLDGRLAADVYLNGADNRQAAEIKAWLRQRPEAAAVLPSGRAD